MTLHWLIRYQPDDLNDGIWDIYLTTIGRKVEEYTAKMQSLKPQKIVMVNFMDDEVYICTAQLILQSKAKLTHGINLCYTFKSQKEQKQ